MSGRGLFLLHEGVGPTIFASQVMEHALAMRAQGIDFSVLSFEVFRRQRAASAANLARIGRNYPAQDVTLRNAVNMYLPGSTLINALLLLRFLRAQRGRFDFIHARADYSAFLALLTKPLHGLPVIWDCRGDAAGELADSLGRKGWLLRATLGTALRLRQRLFSGLCRRHADGAIFVSDALRAQHAATLRSSNCVVVPCPVPESKFFYDAALRTAARASYRIEDDQHVYVYSGSVVAYQGLGDQLGVYQALLARPRNVILFATSDPDQARLTFGALDPARFRIVSVGYEQMNAIYNLADFAFMLREPKHLNWVASPTKFGEYCLTGLPVILNDTVSQAMHNARELGNYVHIDQVFEAERLPPERRQAVALGALQRYARSASVAVYQGLYAAARGPSQTQIHQAEKQ